MGKKLFQVFRVTISFLSTWWESAVFSQCIRRETPTLLAGNGEESKFPTDKSLKRLTREPRNRRKDTVSLLLCVDHWSKKHDLR